MDELESLAKRKKELAKLEADLKSNKDFFFYFGVIVIRFHSHGSERNVFILEITDWFLFRSRSRPCLGRFS